MAISTHSALNTPRNPDTLLLIAVLKRVRTVQTDTPFDPLYTRLSAADHKRLGTVRQRNFTKHVAIAFGHHTLVTKT